MPQAVIDDFSDATRWDAFQPDDTPSAALVAADDLEHHRYLPDATSMRVDASAGAGQHYLSRTLGPLDLTAFPELRFWYRATVASDGSPQRPFRLRLQLGSAALAVGAPGNDWHRFLPALGPGIWQFVRMEMDDLAPQVRGALTTLRLTAVDAAGGWTVWLDDLAACRPELIADVDLALLDLLHERLDIGGTPVPAQVHVPGAPTPQAPWIRIVHHRVDFSDRRADSRRPRTDFTDTGYRLRGESVGYDLYYRVEGATTDRDAQVRMLQFVLDTLGHRGELLAGGLPLPLERVPRPPEEEPSDVPALHYRVCARQERGAHQHVLPVLQTTVTTDLAP